MVTALLFPGLSESWLHTGDVLFSPVRNFNLYKKKSSSAALCGQIMVCTQLAAVESGIGGGAGGLW